VICARHPLSAQEDGLAGRFSINSVARHSSPNFTTFIEGQRRGIAEGRADNFHPRVTIESLRVDRSMKLWLYNSRGQASRREHQHAMA